MTSILNFSIKKKKEKRLVSYYPLRGELIFKFPNHYILCISKKFTLNQISEEKERSF